MINFPSFHLSFNINPIAFTLCGINVYYYAICIVFGIILSLLLCYQSKEKFNIKFDFLWETLIYALIFGFIGARIYYVIFNFRYYSQNPLKILQIRDGGLAIYGGLIAGALVIIKRCKKFKISVLDFFDYLVPFVAIAQSIGRWGNFFNQEAYGTEATSVFRMGIQTIDGYKEVHPAFLYESISTFLIFLILRILQKNRKFKGEIFYFYLLFYSGIRTIIEGIRVDSLMFQNFRISQVLSSAIFVFSSIMLLKKVQKWMHKRLNC